MTLHLLQSWLNFIFYLFTLSWIDLIIPPKFTKKLKKMDSIKGSFVHLECIVSGSHPISIQWYKDGQEITASEKHKYSFHDNTAFLEINKLEGTDSGSYTCEATNKAGSNQCSGFLTVKGLKFFFFSCVRSLIHNLGIHLSLSNPLSSF